MKEKISVLYINAMGPRERTPNGGVFVTQRIKALRELQQVEVTPVSLSLEYSKIVKYLLLLKTGNVDAGKAIFGQMDVTYDIFEIKYSFLEVFLASFIASKAYYYKSKKVITQMIRKYPNVQMIHIHWIWPCAIALPDVSKAYSIPYVVTCHGSDINVTMRNERFRKNMIQILESAYCVEFVSHALLTAAMEQGYSGKNAKVVHNGIDTDFFQGRRIPHTVPTVGFVGNLISIKGADRLPALFQAIYKMMYGGVRFMVVGDGVLKGNLEDKMKGLPVVFYGSVSSEQLADLYAEMDVLLLPSRSEGYGCVIKEAQACGVIPVAADVGGVAEAVGVFGTTIPESDSEEELVFRLAEAVVDYLLGKEQEDVDEMIRDAMKCSWKELQKKSVEEYLSWDNNTSCTCSIAE